LSGERRSRVGETDGRMSGSEGSSPLNTRVAMQISRKPTTNSCDTEPPWRILRSLFHHPEKLLPGRTSEAITQEAAAALAGLAGSLRARHDDPEAAARFLDRIVFCLFAKDVGLLPDGIFADLLEKTQHDPERFARYTAELFRTMATGGEFQYKTIPYFNGGLLYRSRRAGAGERGDRRHS